MERKVLAYIKQNRMIGKKDMVLAGVSGGSDSMAMLHILKELQKKLDFTLRVVHVHHGIRGKEADRDRSFVENICRKWQIPCTVYCYDVPGLSREWKLGEEETGRIVRKEAFQREAAVCGMKIKIALAHNQEDLAETMLHNLCRGTGLRGLCTMRPADGEIIRPILCLSREKIAGYLKQKKIPHIQDSTNLSDEYTRNRIRHHILPMLEQQVNGKAVAHMAETAARISQAEEYLTQQSCQVLREFQKDNGYYFTEKFFMEPQIIRIYALQQAMEQLAGRRKNLTAVHYDKVLELYEMQTGRRISLPYRMEARRDYEGVRLFRCGEEKSAGVTNQAHESSDIRTGKTVCEKESADREWQIRIPGNVTSPLGIFTAEIFSYEGQKIEEKKYTKWLDYDKIKKNPHIRTRRTGDYMVINAQGNTKKLNRCMIDEKIPSEYRDSIPLIACGNEILWMVGSRMNERYKINPQTRKVLVLNYQGGNENE
nr:tRNA lysidine(34) synthetase TilS [uncultured Blautia sp.]